MRILHINKYHHEQDGVGRYMHDVMRLADADGHATAVLAMKHSKNTPSPWEHFFVSNLETAHAGSGIHALRQFARTLWSLEAYKKTRAIIAAFRPDVIHAHNLYTHLSPSVLTAARHAGIPVVLTAHDYGYISANYGLFDGQGPLSPTASWRNVVRTKCIKGSALATGVVDAVVRLQKSCGMWTQGVTHILTASEAVKQAMQRGGYTKARITVIPLPSGVFVGAKNVPPVHLRKPLVVFASRFEQYKGIDVVVDLATRMPDVAFACVGQGSQEEAVRASAARLPNLTVHAMLPPKALWQLMAEASCVLVPSRWPEPFGLVALEALSLGTPAVVSTLGGLSEIVEHGVSGFVEPPESLESWEHDIRALLPKKGKLSKEQIHMQENAAKRGREVGDPQKHKNALFSVYEETIQQKDAL